MSNTIIRRGNIADAAIITKLFYETVHAVNIQDYTQEQVDLWAPSADEVDKFVSNIQMHIFCVAEIDGTIVGFADLTKDSWVDHLFVHKDYQGQGIGKALLAKLQDAAIELGFNYMVTEASITAKPFFERLGFVVVKPQKQKYKGVVMVNYKMMKEW